MSALVIDGKRVAVPGVTDLATWLDDPKRAPPCTDGRPRRGKVTAVVVHTSRAARGVVRPGARASVRAELLARYQTRTERNVSWHLTIDTDGTVLQQADLVRWTAWHAGHANEWTVGIEMVQHQDTGDLWQVQIDATVAVVGTICDALSIPRRIPVDASGAPRKGQVRAWQPKSEGGRAETWAGVLGHHHLTTNKPDGDPGADIFRALLAAGFDGVTP